MDFFHFFLSSNVVPHLVRFLKRLTFNSKVLTDIPITFLFKAQAARLLITVNQCFMSVTAR